MDGFNSVQRIAFEYQGPHHYSVDYVIAHDEIKRAACAANGIRLIEVEAVGTLKTGPTDLQRIPSAVNRMNGNVKFPRHPTWLAEVWRIRKGHWCPVVRR